MGVSNTGFARCNYCGAEFRLFTIFNRDMQGLAHAWKIRHERVCQFKTPEQRRKWAKKHEGKDRYESSLTVELDHPGFHNYSYKKELKK